MAGKKRYGWVYMIRCKVNGKVYIGASIKPNQRWGVHRRTALYGRADVGELYLDMRKFGLNNFVYLKVDWANTPDALSKREEKWVKACEAINPAKGYNKSAYFGGYKLHERINKIIAAGKISDRLYKEQKAKERKAKERKRKRKPKNKRH